MRDRVRRFAIRQDIENRRRIVVDAESEGTKAWAKANAPAIAAAAEVINETIGLTGVLVSSEEEALVRRNAETLRTVAGRFAEKLRAAFPEEAIEVRTVGASPPLLVSGG